MDSAVAEPDAQGNFADRRQMLYHGTLLPSDDREEGIWTLSRFKFSRRGLVRSTTISRVAKRSFAVVGEQYRIQHLLDLKSATLEWVNLLD